MEKKNKTSKKKCTVRYIESLFSQPIGFIKKAITDQRIDVNHVQRVLNSGPLHVTLQHQNIHLLRYLIQDHGANVNIVDHAGQTLLHRAIHCETSLACFELLLKSGADFTVKNRDGWSAFNLCAQLWMEILTRIIDDRRQEYFEKMLQLLLKYGSKLSNQPDYCRYFLVCRAVIDGSVNKVSTSKQIDFPDLPEPSPLVFAVALNNERIVKILLNKGANMKPTIYFRVWSLFEEMVRMQQWTCIRAFLDHQYEMSADCMDTLLKNLVDAGWGFIRILGCRRYHVNVEIENEIGRTPIYRTVRDQSTSLTGELLKIGARSYHCDRYGATPLDIIGTELSKFQRTCYAGSSICVMLSLLLINDPSLYLRDLGERQNFVLHAYRKCSCHPGDYRSCTLLKSLKKLRLADRAWDQFSKILDFEYYGTNVSWNLIRNQEIEDYVAELVELRKVEVMGVTLVDFLQVLPMRAARNSGHWRFQEYSTKCTSDLQGYFPRYGAILRYCFVRVNRLAKVLKAAESKLSFLRAKMPDYCIELVLSHFDEKELEIIVNNS